MNFVIHGQSSMPSIAGGYLVIKLNNQVFHITSVPSPFLLGEGYRDSIVENDDDLEDDDGNHYLVNVWSSNVGVDWEIKIDTADDELKNRVSVEYQPNEF